MIVVFTKKASLLHQERTVFNLYGFYGHMGSDPRTQDGAPNGIQWHPMALMEPLMAILTTDPSDIIPRSHVQ